MTYPSHSGQQFRHLATAFGAAALATCAQVSTAAAQLSNPLTVWNQAYQENYEPDSVSDILANASDAYVLLDPFDADTDENWSQVVSALQDEGNEVSAYISIGTGEDWRSDFAQLEPSLVTKSWDDWGGEYFIDTPDANAVSVMKARIDKLAAYGFDWVEFDNMDWATDDDNRAEYGFSATAADGQDYYNELCTYAHSKGVKCMAKSTVTNAGIFDGATYESYTDDMGWWDEAGAKGFLNAGKPVIIVHYDDPDCYGTLDYYVGIYGDDVSFICETKSANGYIRPDR